MKTKYEEHMNTGSGAQHFARNHDKGSFKAIKLTCYMAIFTKG